MLESGLRAALGDYLCDSEGANCPHTIRGFHGECDGRRSSVTIRVAGFVHGILAVHESCSLPPGRPHLVLCFVCALKLGGSLLDCPIRGSQEPRGYRSDSGARLRALRDRGGT